MTWKLPWPVSARSGSAGELEESSSRDSADRSQVMELAEQFLPTEVRNRWVALLQPAIRLVQAAEFPDRSGGCPARLGGLARMPVQEPWPVWADHGPLAYIGEIDLAQVPGYGLAVPLPAAGRLLFFYFVGTDDASVEDWDPTSMQAARTVFVPEGQPCQVRPMPHGVVAFAEAWLEGQAIVTAPGADHPDLRAEFMEPGMDEQHFQNHLVCDDDFEEALWERGQVPKHQIGGYADPVQNPVEFEVAQQLLPDAAWKDERFLAEAARWRLVLQVDDDESLGMAWGDAGMLYWLARPQDLARGDFSQFAFTLQAY